MMDTMEKEVLTMRNSDCPLSDLRVIELTFASHTTQTHFVHRDDVDKFIVAIKRLHLDHCVNPHSGHETAKVVRIRVGAMKWKGPFWWSTPDLKQNYDPSGVQLIDTESVEDVYYDKKFYGQD